MPKLYSVAEANALLPVLVPLLEDLRNRVAALSAIEADLQQVRRHIQSNGNGQHARVLSSDVERNEAAMRAVLAELREREIEVKDPRSGLIDFYHAHEGRLVYLCWQLGEPRVAYWHEIAAGFAGRRPIGPDGLA